MIIKTIYWLAPEKDCYGHIGLGDRLFLMQCDFCGKEFESSNERKKYCCESCTTQAGIKNRKEKKAHARKRKCSVCSEMFIPPRNDAEYCSDKCRQAAYRERKKVNQCSEVKKPFILKVGKIHKNILNRLDNYDVGGYHFTDIVEGVPNKTDETFLIVRESGEILKTFDKPFEKNYSFENRYTQLTPDMMIRFCDDSMHSYSMKTKMGIIFEAVLKREVDACNNL